mgnify:CR=1 FL=1
MAVYDKAHELASELKQSDEYREYQKAKAQVSDSESAMSILRDYRKQEITFQSALLTGQQPTDDDKKEMERLTGIVEMHGPVKRYLEAERRVFVMFSDIQKILTEALNLLDI